MASIIGITFQSEPVVNDFLRLFNPVYNNQNGVETFKTQRTGPYQSTINSDLNILAENYLQAFLIDYNAIGNFVISRVDNIVTISTPTNGVFDGWSSSNSFVDVTVINTANQEDLEITNVSYSEADSDPCNNVKVTITANKTFTNITEPVTDTNSSDTYSFDLSRSINYIITISNGVETFTSPPQNNLTPTFIDEEFVEFSEQGTPQGTILSVSYGGNLNDNSLEYSLDGVTYQSSPVFSNLTPDTYSVYLRDLYGCVKVVSVTIGNLDPGQQTAKPFFDIAKSNPIYFVEDVELGDCANKGVDSNISQAQGYSVNRTYLQPYKSCDGLIPIQIKSSYRNVNALVKDCDGNIIEDISVNKLTDNINAFDSRDAFKFRDSNGFIRVYFKSGQTYDANGVSLNAPFNLDGLYPDGYSIGSYIKIDNTWELITAIIYNFDLERFELVTTENPLAPVPDTAVIVSTYYNIQGYDIYRAELEIVNLPDGIYQIEVVYSDVGQPITGNTWVSELIEVYSDDEDVQPNHIIEYASTINNEIVYSTGFIGKMRLPYDVKPIYKPTDEIETYQTDNKLVQIESNVYDQYEFSFFGLSMNVTKQLVRILANDVIFIDGVQFSKISTPEVEQIGNTNTYKFKITMQQQGEFNYVANSFDVYSLNNGSNFAFGSYIVDGFGNYIDSNGLIVDS